MIASCTQCQARHQLNTEFILGSVAKFKCLKCGHMNKVEIAPSENESTTYTADNGLAGGSGIGTEVQAEPVAQAASTQEAIQESKPQISGLSIKVKLTCVIVALVVISLTIVGVIASFKGEEALTQQATNHLHQITSQKAREYNKVFSRLQQEIEGLAVTAQNIMTLPQTPQDINFRILMPWTGSSYGNPNLEARYRDEIIALKHIGLIMQGVIRNNPYLELSYMATPNNVFVADKESATGVIEAEEGFVSTKRPWYINAVKKGRTVWTQPYVDVNTKKLIVSCATPVYDNDKNILGVVGFDVKLETLRKDIASLDIGYNSEAFLIAKDGSMLARPGMAETSSAWNKAVKTDNALATNDMELKEIVSNMIAGRTGLGEYGLQGDRIIVSYAYLDAIDASLGVKISEQEVMKPAIDIRNIILGVWGAVVVVAIFVGLAIGNGITKPINELSRRADLMSQGKSDLEELKVTRKDEIGLLIESYNRLISSLQIAMSRRRR